ncbi:TerB family tellurite resistance protein [Myxococcota bacterium]|nr:TerB family tellurite resistance protein [Myxococcota bacterium]
MISEFFSEQNLSFEHVKALTRAMLTVARVDGVHDNEMKLVREFYESCARAGDPRLEEIGKGAFDVEAAKGLFDTPELAKMMVKTLVLLAFADGAYGKAEDALIREYAAKLGLGSADVDALLEATRGFLIGSLAHVQNLDALKQVSRKLSTDN